MVKCDIRVLKLKDYFSTKDNDFIAFYTGLPNFYVLKVMFDFVAPPTIKPHKLSSFQEFLVVMLYLRLNCSCEDL